MTVTHRMHGTAEYRTWRSMRNRCLNPKADDYEHYGGRGIGIAPEWDSFERFFADMGSRPPGSSLDRRDNNAGYCKNNCRWATQREQQNNRRKTMFFAEPEGRRAVGDVCAETGAIYSLIHGRAKRGWSLEAALSLPKNTKHRHARAILVEVGGERLNLQEACNRLAIPYERTRSRIKKLGWPIEVALADSNESSRKWIAERRTDAALRSWATRRAA